MKKVLYFIFLITAIMIVVQSCKKDEINEKQENETVYTDEAMSIWHNLVNFKSKIDNPLKSGDYMSRDSVVWYLEALLNSTQVSSDSPFRLLSYRSSLDNLYG
ncbi:MAG: hypothetical protein JEY97_08905 [Bacteroidales bacterium]|nr:hypothetical protein [Bacteroidales bacterium]